MVVQRVAVASHGADHAGRRALVELLDEHRGDPVTAGGERVGEVPGTPFRDPLDATTHRRARLAHRQPDGPALTDEDPSHLGCQDAYRVPGEEREHLAVGRVTADRRVGGCGWKARHVEPAVPDGSRRPGHEHGRAQRRPIAVARVRVPDRAERGPAERDAGVEALGEALQQHTGRGVAVGHFPERGRPAADHALVVVVERPDAVPRDVEDFAAKDAEAEAQQYVELVSAQPLDRR